MLDGGGCQIDLHRLPRWPATLSGLISSGYDLVGAALVIYDAPNPIEVQSPELGTGRQGLAV